MIKTDYYFEPNEKSSKHPLFGFKFIKTALEYNKTLVYVSVFYLIFVTLIAEGYQIPTDSMYPTLNGDRGFFTGDRIFALKGISHFFPLKRGDIVIFVSVEDREKFVVKRLVGLPGETIEIKNYGVYINGERLTEPPFNWIDYQSKSPRKDLFQYATEAPLTIPKDCYFVLGDNSGNSRDSRVWGWLTKRDLLGKAALIWFPLSRGKILQ